MAHVTTPSDTEYALHKYSELNWNNAKLWIFFKRKGCIEPTCTFKTTPNRTCLRERNKETSETLPNHNHHLWNPVRSGHKFCVKEGKRGFRQTHIHKVISWHLSLGFNWSVNIQWDFTKLLRVTIGTVKNRIFTYATCPSPHKQGKNKEPFHVPSIIVYFSLNIFSPKLSSLYQL